MKRQCNLYLEEDTVTVLDQLALEVGVPRSEVVERLAWAFQQTRDQAAAELLPSSMEQSQGVRLGAQRIAAYMLLPPRPPRQTPAPGEPGWVPLVVPPAPTSGAMAVAAR